LRYSYKIIPLQKPHPAYPGETAHWVPVLSVRLSHGHGKQTNRFEALIDSGAGDCLFHADLCSALQIKLEKGAKGEVAGVARGVKIQAYYHGVKLWVGADILQITAGFVEDLPVAGLLGRHGFFENHIITFDPSANPPGFDLQRLGRA
jgi:hypothetical protein